MTTDKKRKTMENTESKVELGCKVEDIVTGFKGVAIGITEYLTGCDVVGVKPYKLKDGLPQDACWIDRNQLRVIAEPTVEISSMFRKKTDAGGPHETPPKR